jgi:hypothetical protein
MMIPTGTELLVSEAATCRDPKRLFKIVATSDDELVRRLVAQNENIDISAIELVTAYLQNLVENNALAGNTATFPERVEKIFEQEVEQVAKLQIPVASQWWEYLIGHSSPDVRQKAANNPYFPNRLRDIVPNLDVYVRMGFVFNPTIEPDRLRILSLDKEPSIATVATARLAGLSSQDDTPAPTRIEQGLYTSFAKKDEKDVHPIVFVLAIVAILALGVGLTILSPVKKENVGMSASPRGGVVTSPVALPTTTAITNAPDHYAEAVSIANKASLLATKANSKGDWVAIAALWDSAIFKLRMVSNQDVSYARAQNKILDYETIKDVAKQKSN